MTWIKERDLELKNFQVLVDSDVEKYSKSTDGGPSPVT